MNDTDEEKAWRLWNLMQEATDALWARYEPAFLDFCIREDEHNAYMKAGTGEPADDLPF